MRLLIRAAMLVMATMVGMVLADGLTSASEPTVLYQDDFSSPLSGWKEDRFWSYNEGEYRGFLNVRHGIIASPLPQTSLFGRSNFCIAAQVRLHRAPGLTDNGFMGIYFGGITASGNDFPTTSILVGIDSFGQLVAQENFYDERTNDVDPRFLLNVPGAVQNPTRFHTIQLSILNGQVEILLDGQFVGAINVSSTSGEIGVMAFSFDEPNLNARFDNIAVVDVC